MSEDKALILNNIEKKFGKLKAVSELSLSVSESEIYSLIGPNGAGKTTTVKMITGLLAPTSGSINVFGIDINKEPEAAKKLLGYIPDEPFVYEYLTGREFLQFVGDLYGLERNETNSRIKKLLTTYSLEGIIDNLFSDYSRGNKQKTIIIANLIHEPKLLIIDEPIIGLDVQSQEITKKIFTDFKKNGGSILVCTHTLSIAQEIADRIGVIVEGKLVEEGTFGDLRKRAKKEKADLEELYLRITSK